MGMIIRKAKLSDAEGMARLYMQFWEVHKGLDPLIEPAFKPDLKNNLKWAEKDVRSRKNITFVAVVDGKVVGYMELLVKKNEHYFKIKKYGYVNAVVVDRKYRRKGIARALIKEGLKIFRSKGLKYVQLSAYVKYRVPKIWERMGFKTTSEMMIRKIT